MAEACQIIHSALLPSFYPVQKLHTALGSRLDLKNRTKNHPTRQLTIQCSGSSSPSSSSLPSVSATTAERVVGAEKVPWGCDIDSLENAEALQQWLSQSGLPPQKMSIQKVEVGERGLVASKNIRKGEKLLFVPPSLVITADSVRVFLGSRDFGMCTCN
jgi:hypothetical protein